MTAIIISFICLLGADSFAARTAEELYRRAEGEFAAGKLKSAEPYLLEIRERHERHRLYWPAGLMWARCATELGESKRRFKLLAGKAPADVRAECELELAFLEVISGNFALAEKAYSAWLKTSADHNRADEARFWRGISLKETGRIEEAKDALTVLKNEGQDRIWRAQSGLLLAQITFEKKRFPEARLEYLALAGELWAKDVRPQALLGAARSARASDREDEATKLLRRLIAESPDLPEAREAESLLKKTGRSEIRIGVQVGAFGKEALARNLKRQYETKGYSVSITERSTGRLMLYGVVLGPYKSREEANRVKEKLRKTGVEAFVAEF